MQETKDKVITVRLTEDTYKRLMQGVKRLRPEIRNRSHFIEVAIERLLAERPPGSKGAK